MLRKDKSTTFAHDIIIYLENVTEAAEKNLQN